MCTATRMTILGLVLALGIVGCETANRVVDPTIAITPVTDAGDVLPLVNGQGPPLLEPPDSIKAIGEQLLHGRGQLTPNQYIAGVAGSAIVNQGNSWLGVPYAWGGNSRSGIDCSHLVYQVYQGAGIRSYPFMTTSAMQRYSHFICVNPDVGDIVLFSSLGHTGIYAGSGWMIDADSFYGRVMYDYLYTTYWQNYGWYTVKYMP